MRLSLKTLKISIITVLLLVAGDCLGQHPSLSRFEVVALPYNSNEVEQVVQDHYGMIWLVTRQGVYTFDGYAARRVLGGNYYAGVEIDKRILCFGSDHGLRWLDANSRQPLSNLPKLGDNYDVRSLLYQNGKVFVGTRSHGVISIDMRHGAKTETLMKPRGSDIVFSLCPYRSGVFACHINGLAFIDAKGKVHDWGIRKNVYVIKPDARRHCFWIGTEQSLLKRDMLTGATETVLRGTIFTRIIFSLNHDLLLANEYGLEVYDPETGSMRTVNHNASKPGKGLPSNRINFLFRDRQSNLWVATDRGAAISLPDDAFDYRLLADITHSNDGNYITQVLVDSRGDQWLGGDNGLLHISGSNVSVFKVGHGLRKNMIRTIYEDRDHDIWIATDAGVARYDRGRNTFDYFTITDRHGRNADWAYGIYEDARGQLWIATYMGGLFVVNKRQLLSSGGTYRMQRSPMERYDSLVSTVYRLIDGGNGLLWAYTSLGLTTIDTRSYKVSLKRRMYLDAMAVAGGAVWIDVMGCLYRYDIATGQFREAGFKVRDGMIYTLVPENNRVWMPTSEGLFYINVANSTIHPYGRPEYNFTSGFFIPSANAILWGGEDVLAVQRMNDIATSRPMPQVCISNVSVDGKPSSASLLCAASSIDLDGRENIVISFATLDYSKRNSEIFWYKLREDGQWKSLPAGTNSLTIPYLQGGNYELYVSSEPMQKGLKAAVFHIHVPYPWFLRWWAWMLYILFFLTLMLSVINYYRRREQRVFNERKREAALALTQQKMDFFVDMSHELKTPLSLIIAPIEKMISESTNTKIRARLKAIHNNAMRLSAIIHRILDYKRLETVSDDEVLASRIELMAFLKDCVSNFQPCASERGISLTVSSSEAQIWMTVDIVKIQMVVSNLLSNAMKYVQNETGRIEIVVTRLDKSVRISVCDNGPGVPKGELNKIFTRYYKGDYSHHGSGIGLSVVRKYVELHGGEVYAKNENGLVVSFTLPIQLEKEVAGRGDDRVEEKSDPIVLVIDDNAEMVEFLVTALGDNYCCITAYSGEEALEKVKDMVPDIVITDQMMPGMDGTELCRRLRHYHPTANVPIIMLTAKDDSETEMESISCGADIFMSKPFNLRKLQLHLVQLLKRRVSIEQSAHIDDFASRTEMPEKLSDDELLMTKVIRQINDNMMSDDLNVNTLSTAVGVDQKQLYRKIKLLTGLSPVSFIRSQRMKRAALLLEQGQLSVSEVMYQVGFSSLSYFSKCFIKEFGVSPKEYKDKQKEKGNPHS
jgi:signal transduction histidine kinase/DNA-binding response OmpR family regulator/ligand-binding sensor domain-containing protein